MNRLARILVFATALLWIGCAPSTEDDPFDPVSTPLTHEAESPIRTSGPNTYYVRPDGGSTAQCTGLVDASYPGSGTGQPCAWDHPFRALPPQSAPEIAGGDTLIVAGGSYEMGYGAPGTDECEADGAFECHMPPVPSGPDPTHPTRILGAGWETGCAAPPQLWGTERAWFVINLTGSSNIHLACFEITDHSDCVESHTGGLACRYARPPFGPWADVGIYAQDAANVRMHDLNVHGLATAGIKAGRIADWTVEDVRLAGNGWVGWEGDIDGDDSNSGTLSFRRWKVEWNGCGETYPAGQPTGCWGQSAGGYGDGVGTGATGGHWIIEDSAFEHNTSDGLDLLYVREEGSRIEIRRTVARGNAGDQIKTAGPTEIENVLAVSDCGFFSGKPFTHEVDPCRSGGSAIALNLRAGDEATVVHATLAGQGDCLLIAECQEGHNCAGSAPVLLRSVILLGYPEFSGEGDVTCLTWTPIEPDPIAIDHAIIRGVKNPPDVCPAASLCDAVPGLVDERLETFDGHLQETSLAIDMGASDEAPTEDVEGRPRDDAPDVGAFER